MNTRLIITLLNIPRVGKKTTNKLLKFELPKQLNILQIKELFIRAKHLNKEINIPSNESIEEGIKKAEKIIEKSNKLNIGYITILDKEFPQKLKFIKNPPPIIYYKGNKECIFNDKSIAIIGSRKANEHSLKVSYRLAEIFTSDEFIIISGLAKGCDEFAHKGCINSKGKTIAVLPCGLDTIYPKSNEFLADEILKYDGCLISEYQVDTEVQKNNLIERDRIQSALSQCVLIVEASIDSGTMHTANYAIEQNKILACYQNPNILNINMGGNEKLIKENKAIIISNKNEINDLKYKINANINIKVDNNINTSNDILQLSFL
ncbi:DNA-processing protein DprA [Clostridium nigeriense]|uniref:DNA-processing protein DprA n=1 Tax=Clostridium nigeriense TaxID=1805470 RepID=UPI003D35058C